MEVSKGMDEVVVLAKRSMNLKGQLLEKDRALNKKQQDLKIEQEAVLGAKPSDFE